ncbi:MAG: lysine--tRNA ligase [Candidatus Taylorbacteria bacterium]|nr:lysine--tRNA ligase [Candidatus Taylorbacteria bacterium]
MSSLDELRQARLKKLQLLNDKGIDPYPILSKREVELGILSKRYSEFESRKELTIAGRVMALRIQGALAFADLFDGTGKFQGLVKKDEAGAEAFDLFTAAVDMGDFVELTGSLFISKRGEKTLLAGKWRMLSKSLRPLPDKWEGIQDVEERYRRRYLDLLSNESVRSRFETRSKTISLIRNFYNDHGYIEVETPRLQSIAGGATAQPFVTHHKALDVDMYLTIAQELFLKELLIGGLNKVYEIGRKFRNEGIDVTHNPEFTMLESQEAYSDAEGQMAFIEELTKYLVKNVAGSLEISYEGEKIDFEPKFPKVPFYDLIKKYALITNPESITMEDLKLRAAQFGVFVAPSDSKDKILDNLYKKLARPKLVQPTFIVDYPVEFNPFAKRKEKDPSLIDRFQLIAGGLEFVNAFSELNNPVDQKARYIEQDEKRKKGESEIAPSDMEYLEAMEYGMPPNGGIGIGIDRLVMLLTDQKNIREVILFPTLRPKRPE